MTSAKSIERSIDTLQRIYAIIAALAINEALKRTFLESGAGDVELDVARLPEFLAFIVTVVPFVHGMNRHLDKTLATIKASKRRWLFGVLLIDFVVFMVEACILFLLATSVKSETFFFRLLILLLLIDLVWSFLTWPITRRRRPASSCTRFPGSTVPWVHAPRLPTNLVDNSPARPETEEQAPAPAAIVAGPEATPRIAP